MKGLNSSPLGFSTQIGWFGLVIKWDWFYMYILEKLLKPGANRGEHYQAIKDVSVLEQGDKNCNRVSNMNETNICSITEASLWLKSSSNIPDILWTTVIKPYLSFHRLYSPQTDKHRYSLIQQYREPLKCLQVKEIIIHPEMWGEYQRNINKSSF